MMRSIALLAPVLALALAACGGGNKGSEDAEEEEAATDVETEDGEEEDADDDADPGDAPDDPVGDPPSDPPPADVADDEPVSDTLRFTNIRCLPDVGGGDDVVAGQNVSCRFGVQGATGRRVTLSCEDDSGTAVDCSSSSTTQIQPFGSNPLPVFNGWFGMGNTSSLGGTTVVTIWVADDTVGQARHRFEANVIADDGTNGPPTIEVDCGGDTDGSVSVTAGARLDCTLYILDPDPDDVSWDYTQTSGATPVTPPSPYGGTGRAPYDVTWRWQSDSSESGTFVYTFSADDGTASTVTYDLTVDVS
ncbi:MAG: hypothetical protein JRG91_02110 [Deltaproteobacteria bacterium]|nr:hypothetical protein [Deltaproteobacteria bacterium]